MLRTKHVYQLRRNNDAATALHQFKNDKDANKLFYDCVLRWDQARIQWSLVGSALKATGIKQEFAMRDAPHQDSEAVHDGPEGMCG